MSRSKIIFLIVLIAVGLFIASIVASMFATRQSLPMGYQLSMGAKGEAWVQSKDRRTLVTDVASVWASSDRMLVERWIADRTRPGAGHCDYQATDAQGVLHPVSDAEARVIVKDMTPRSPPLHSCLGVEG